MPHREGDQSAEHHQAHANQRPHQRRDQHTDVAEREDGDREQAFVSPREPWPPVIRHSFCPRWCWQAAYQNQPPRPSGCGCNSTRSCSTWRRSMPHHAHTQSASGRAQLGHHQRPGTSDPHQGGLCLGSDCGQCWRSQLERAIEYSRPLAQTRKPPGCSRRSSPHLMQNMLAGRFRRCRSEARIAGFYAFLGRRSFRRDLSPTGGAAVPRAWRM